MVLIPLLAVLLPIIIMVVVAVLLYSVVLVLIPMEMVVLGEAVKEKILHPVDRMMVMMD